MTPHDRARSARAAAADAHSLDALELMSLEALREARDVVSDAVAGIQSTDEPMGTPEGAELARQHDSLLEKWKRIDAELARRARS